MPLPDDRLADTPRSGLRSLFTVRTQALLFTLFALAIVTPGYSQTPATQGPSATQTITPPTTSPTESPPVQNAGAPTPPAGMPSGSPRLPTVGAPRRRTLGSAGQPPLDRDTVTRLQIFLDENSFGPGEIDGRWNDFTEKALQRFQAANGQQPADQIGPALQQELQKISPTYTTYTLAEGDL